MSAPDFDAMRARTDAATPGPWWTGMHDGFSYVVEGPEADSHPVAQRLIRPDAEFIAHAREDMTVLLDWADGVRAALKREHQVMPYRDYSEITDRRVRTGCPTCRTDGPCDTRKAVTH